MFAKRYRKHIIGDLKRDFTTVGFETIDDTGVVSGFSGSNYLMLPNAFAPASGDTWEMVWCFSASDITSEGCIFGNNANSGGVSGINIRIASGKMKYTISTSGSKWEVSNSGSTALSANLMYWVKATYDGSTLVFSLSTDGFNYTTDYSVSTTQIAGYTQVIGSSYHGSNANYSTFAFDNGAVYLKECYIKINGEYWWSGFYPENVYDNKHYAITRRYVAHKAGDFLKGNYTIVGSPTITSDGVVSGFSTSNYLLTPNSVNLNSVNSWEIVIRAKHNSGSLLQQHSSAPYTIALQCGMMLVNLSGSAWTVVYENTAGLITGNWYYIRATFNGASYRFERAEDAGEYVVLATLENSTKIISNNQPFILGINDVHTDPFKGSIDLSQSYIKINGQYWWTGFYTEDVIGCKRYLPVRRATKPVNETEYTTAGTYALELGAGEYDIEIVGGGGGGATATKNSTGASGGSGAAFVGTVSLEQGIYAITVGKGGANGASYDYSGDAGGASSISLNGTTLINAGGGGGGNTDSSGGSAGTLTLNITPTSTTLQSNGKGGSGWYGGGTTANTASVYGGYGYGGGGGSTQWGAGKAGGVGYVKITPKGDYKYSYLRYY